MQRTLQESARGTASDSRVIEHPATRSRFFVTMAALLFILVIVGFAPSFYLKVFFGTRELAWYVHLHAAVLTAWYTLFLAQTLLIAANRTATH